MYTFSGFVTLKGQQRAKQEVLHDREFAEHLDLVHLDHAAVDLAPVWHAADVIKHGAGLMQRALLHLGGEGSQ